MGYYENKKVLSIYIFEYNFCKWLSSILISLNPSKNDSPLNEALNHLTTYQTFLEKFIFYMNFNGIEHMQPMVIISSRPFQAALRMWVNTIKNAKTKEKWDAILQFMENCPEATHFADIQKSLINESDVFCIFPDNE